MTVRRALRIFVGVGAIAIVIVGVLALFESVLPVGGAACTPGATCWDNRGLFESIGLTYVVVGTISLTVAANARRGGNAGLASGALGASIAIAVGILAPVWAPPQLPLDLAALRLLAVVLGSVVCAAVIRRLRLAPDWPWGPRSVRCRSTHPVAGHPWIGSARH